MRSFKKLATARTVAATATFAAIASLTTPASAVAGSSVQRQVNEILAAHPDAHQTAPGIVAFPGGAELSIPAPGAVTKPCKSGYYCFFQDINFGGRKLTFHDCTDAGKWQFLTDYGFGHQTSSWQNYSGNTVLVFDQSTTPPTQLWTEVAHGEATFVGAAANDKADSFETFCGGSPR